MKKLLSVVLFLLPLTALRGEILLVEDFVYPVSEYEPLVLVADEWTNDYFDADKYYQCYSAWVVDTADIAFPSYVGSGVGNALYMWGETGAYHPERSFKRVTSGDVYAAFLFKPDWGDKSGFFFTLRQNQATGGDGDFTMNGRVSVELDTLGNAFLGLQYGKESETHISDFALENGRTYLIVVKYTVREGDGNDEVSLYAFTEMPLSEPAVPLIGPVSDPLKPDMEPAWVMLRGVKNANYALDGIRIGTTWKDALGRDDAPNGLPATAWDPFSAGAPFVLYDASGCCLGDFTELPARLPHRIYMARTPDACHKIVL